MESSLWNWLAGSEGEAALAQATQSLQQGSDALRVLTGLRRSYGPDKAAAALEQAQLRRRAAGKFSAAPRMLFTSRGLVQATGEVIARYKAERIGEVPVIDLCCGIGGDLIAFAKKNPSVGVDQDPDAVFCAAFNCSVAGATAQVICGRAEQITLDPGAAIHLDPDRRAGGQRTINLRHVAPSLAFIESLLDQRSAVSLKLAPATVLPTSWYSAYEVEWIGHRGECKQQIVWSGSLARNVGRRAATVIASDGVGQQQMVGTSLSSQPPPIGELSRYILEPHPAVLAARLSDDLAKIFRAWRFSPNVAYLTANEAAENMLASCFDVIETFPLKPSALNHWLREKRATVVEVKTRGLAGIDLKGFSRLKPHGENRFTLILTRIATQARAIICKRVTA